MKVVKISAIWCGACLIMNKVFEEMKKKYPFEFVELDYDFDEEEVKKYSCGDILPVFIFYQDNLELFRLTGEFSFQEVEKKLKEVGVMDEKN